MATFTDMTRYRNKLDHTMKIRVSKEMMAALERIAATKSQERGLHVGASTLAREVLTGHIHEQERRHVRPGGSQK